MEGVFVTAIDTGIGKTVVSAGLIKMVHGARKAAYWKPIQTGTIVGDDTNEVKGLTDLSPDCFVEPVYRFAEPLSPYMAGKKWGKTVDMATILNAFKNLSQFDFLVVEGAGGLLVPLSEKDLQIDLMKAMKLPLIVVAEDRVGAINQTLLTVERARADKIPVLGVVLTRARGTFGNSECISHFGQVEILAELPPSDSQKQIVAQVACHPTLRKLFKLPPLPM